MDRPPMKAIVTMPPYAPYMKEVLEHPLVSGIRLNTVMPIKDSQDEIVRKMDSAASALGKEFWVDLKCRQLRVASMSTPPYTAIQLSHKIEVFTPCTAYFGSRGCAATVLEVDDDKLIMQDGPKRVLGPGESVTIPHPTLRVQGILTDTDRKYCDAVNKLPVPRVMASFVENHADVAEVRKYSPKARIIAKIESPKGRDFVKHDYAKSSDGYGLMAARGDLYMEFHWPQEIIPTLETILAKDPQAVVASRIFDSFAEQPEPTCADIGDVDGLMRMGYRNYMFGDEVCMRRESVMSALNLLADMARGR